MQQQGYSAGTAFMPAGQRPGINGALLRNSKELNPELTI